MQGILIRYINRRRHRRHHHSLLQHSLLVLMAAYVGPQCHIMEITITIHHQHHCRIVDTICSHHHTHQVRISSHVHLNQSREHSLGIAALRPIPILRDISMVDMIEDTMDMIEDLTLMIEGIALMVEGITSMMECITSMIDGATFMIGGKCTMKLWMVEGFPHSFHQAPHVQITLKRRHPTNFTADDHWILHQVHVLGGPCLIGDPSTLLIPDTQWNLQSPMEEVGGRMEDVIMIDTIDD